MKYVFLLSGDYIDLAREEALSLFEIKKCKSLNSLLVADLNNNENEFIRIFRRLALAKSIYKFLFECKVNDLIEAVKDFDWNSIYKDNFCVRVHNLDNSMKNSIKIQNQKILTTSKSNAYGGNPLAEKRLAGYIWKSVKKPKVSLENPKTFVQFFIFKNKAYCGLLAYENKEDFESRRTHLRPFTHPSSLHPKLARALVNLTGIKEKETLLDPFCGTGGFLIEAGLMGIKGIGYDIYKIMAAGCKKNLEHYRIKEYRIKNRNALDINDRFDCVATDLPYGLNSNVLLKHEKGFWKQNRLNKKIQKKGFVNNLEKFYLAFLMQLRKNLKKKAVIVFPDYVNYKKLLKTSKFRIEREFSDYVHRSLSRKIVRIS